MNKTTCHKILKHYLELERESKIPPANAGYSKDKESRRYPSQSKVNLELENVKAELSTCLKLGLLDRKDLIDLADRVQDSELSAQAQKILARDGS